MAETTEVLMPLMGEGITEATLVKWLKKPGEKVAKDEPLLEVSTDKVDTEIPAPASGYVIATFAAEGAVVTINSVIAQIGAAPGSAANEPTAAPPANGAHTTPNTSTPPSEARAPASPGRAPLPEAPIPVTPAAPAAQRPGDVRSSPLVRKIARENQVDLAQVVGSGLNGRITKQDILTYLSGPIRPTAAAALPATTPSDRLRTESIGGVEYLDGVAVRREPLSKMRRLIAEHMVRSVRVSPHVTTVFEIDLHRVVATRERYKSEFERREGFKLTYTPFFLHAAVEAIKRHPLVNVSVDGDDVLYKDDINLGCAVALENGLIVPVIKRAQELNLLGIARRLNDLVTRARSKKLSPEDVQGGTFSVTNPGGFGSLTSNPIINQPQVAILGIGAVVKRPVVIEGDAIAIRPMILMSLTFDHRVVDGEGGARYLATLKQILETYDAAPL